MAKKLFKTLASGRFWGFKKKHQNARSFAQQFLWSAKCYGPGRSVKRCSNTSSLHSKKNFLLRGCRFFV